MSERPSLHKMLIDGPVRIIIDATHRQCVVPRHLKDNDSLHLDLSYNFKGHDMHWGADALEVTLSFGGSTFRCELPWAAMIAAGPLPKTEAPKKPSHLRLVRGEA